MARTEQRPTCPKVAKNCYKTRSLTSRLARLERKRSPSAWERTEETNDAEVCLYGVTDTGVSVTGPSNPQSVSGQPEASNGL